MKKFIRCFSAMVVFALLAAAIAAPVCAAEETTSLRLSFLVEEHSVAVPNAALSVYKLADPDEDGGLIWLAEYADHAFAPSELSDQELVAKAAELAKFVAGQKDLSALYTPVTDKDGFAEAAAEDGLYLLCGDAVKLGSKTYTPTPALLFLPQTDGAGDRLEKLDVEIKYTVTEPGQKDPTNPQNPTTGTTPNKTPSATTPSKNVSTPGTGDALTVWIAVCVLSACGLLLVTARRNRKEGGL